MDNGYCLNSNKTATMDKHAGIREKVQALRNRIREMTGLSPKSKPRSLNAEQVLAHAAKNNHTLTMRYVDKKGKETVRETEPYEIKDGHYWGYSLDGPRPGIRKFKLDRIKALQETSHTYMPRWEVKLGSVGGAKGYTIAGGQWGEGESLEPSLERSIRMKYDNAIGGGRYTPKYKNSFIKMKHRGSNPYTNQL